MATNASFDKIAGDVSQSIRQYLRPGAGETPPPTSPPIVLATKPVISKPGPEKSKPVASRLEQGAFPIITIINPDLETARSIRSEPDVCQTTDERI